jgi:long-chain acyl-CoA synthetase
LCPWFECLHGILQGYVRLIFDEGTSRTEASLSVSCPVLDPKNTKEALDDEGWLHTGDVAEIDSVGRVKIIDRVKNIMKLAQGEYVALEKIENLFGSNPLISQIYVHGDSLQSYLLAVVVLDPILLAGVVSRILGKQITPGDELALAEAIKDDRVNAYVLSELTKVGQKNGLNGYVIFS